MLHEPRQMHHDHDIALGMSDPPNILKFRYSMGYKNSMSSNDSDYFVITLRIIKNLIMMDLIECKIKCLSLIIAKMLVTE